MSDEVKDDTSRTATITPTTAADVPCSENNSNLSNDQFQKCALPCQLRGGLVTRGVLIDKSRGSIITFTLGVALIAICWGLLAAFSKESDNLSKWWYDTSSIVGQLSLLSFCPFLIGTMTKMGYETRSGFRDLMLTMGLKMSTYYFYWILHELLLWSVVTVALASIMYPTGFGGPDNSSFLTPLVWFGLLFLNSIPCNFFLCTIITSTKYQILVGIIWFYGVGYLAGFSDDNITAKVALAFLPATNFALAPKIFSAYLHPPNSYVDPTLHGLKVRNWDKVVRPDDLVITTDRTTNMSIGALFLVSIASLCVWSFVAFWLENVKPFDMTAGDKKHPLFFLEYLRPQNCFRRRADFREQRVLPDIDPEIVAANESVVLSPLGVPVEPITSELQACVRVGDGICVRKLRKIYRETHSGLEINALNDLTLTMFPGQVTGLLGHNGAGKTTAISCLTGSLSISAGDIYIRGYSMRTHVMEIRQMIGICPQKNVLHCDLTVEQHLQLFAAIKGLSGDEATKAVEETLHRLSLVEKRSSLAKTLSGGQKRKLHVGIAFSGNSTVVFLDEPTAGMDPHTRRSTWETIQDYKSGRVIALCSHYMDEIDILADRVAIMSAGSLQCVGSPLFLKKIYGVGYNLTLVGDPGDDANPCGPARFKTWISAIHNHIPKAVIISTHGSEAQIQLPDSVEARAGILPLLRFIETNRENMGIVHYTLNSTTLEEVYLSAARGDVPKDVKLHGLPAPIDDTSNDAIPRTTGMEAKRESGESSSSSLNIEEGGLIELPQQDKPFAGSKQLPLRQIRAIITVRLATRFRRKAEIFWGFLVPLSLYILLIIMESLEGHLRWNWNPVTAGNVYGAMLSLGIYFTVMPLGAFCVEDRVRGIKAQQILMGVKRSTYWIGLFICDYLVSFILACIALIGLSAASSPTITEGRSFLSMTILSLWLAAAPLAWTTYWLSFKFNNKALATAVNMWAGIIFGILLGTLVLNLISDESRETSGMAIRWLLIIFFPHYCVFDTISHTSASAYAQKRGATLSSDFMGNVWNINSSGGSYLFLWLHLIFWFGITVWAEKRSISKAASRVTGAIEWDADLQWISIDPDIEAEKKRAMGDESKQSALALQEVRKIYPGQSSPSVRDISLTVQKGECFGLLGVNGAGKSTTMGMICTTVMPSSGNILISGEEIYDKPELLAKHIGYCPQFDALWDHVSPIEHLKFCARCRGYAEEDVIEVVDSLINLLDLGLHANKYSKHLSGGNKRKLSLGMAVLGNPTIVLLDEPSAGVDPVARQHMWRVLSAASRNSAIILTSHSMEAVQALCSRICIMVAGRLRACGTPSQLTMQYSSGYKIDIMVEVASAEDIATYARAAELPLEGSLSSHDDLETVLMKVTAEVKDCVMIGIIGRILGNGGESGITGTATISAMELASFACNADRRQRILDFMFDAYPESQLAEAQGTRLTFHTDDRKTSLADMVETLQNRPDDVAIVSFSLGQTTLEQVFNTFAAQAAVEAELMQNAYVANSIIQTRKSSTISAGPQSVMAVSPIVAASVGVEEAHMNRGDWESVAYSAALDDDDTKYSVGTIDTDPRSHRIQSFVSFGLVQD